MKVLQAVGFYLVYPLLWVLSWLPMFVLYRLSDFLFLIILIVGYRKKIINDNLSRAFPDKSPKDLRKIRLRFYRHFCDLIVETIVIENIPLEEMKFRLRAVNPEIIEEYLNEGKDIIAVLGHYGNWEWVPSINLSFQVAGISVYRPLKNPYFDRYMLRLRNRFGTINVEKKLTAREVIQHKRKNVRFVLGLICDQSPGKNELDYWTSFLGQNTPIILGPEKMARLTDAVVLFWDMEKIKRGQYQLSFIPFPGDVKTAEEFEITEWHVRMLERQIRKKPEYWLWSHRRWKHQHLYKET